MECTYKQAWWTLIFSYVAVFTLSWWHFAIGIQNIQESNAGVGVYNIILNLVSVAWAAVNCYITYQNQVAGTNVAMFVFYTGYHFAAMIFFFSYGYNTYGGVEFIYMVFGVFGAWFSKAIFPQAHKDQQKQQNKVPTVAVNNADAQV